MSRSVTAASACASRPRSLAVVSLLTLVIGSGFAGLASSNQAKKSADKKKPEFPEGKAFRLLVDQGDPAKAQKYYGGVVTQQVGFVTGYDPDGKPTGAPLPPLDALLDYCGYKELKAADIEKLPSSVLMDVAELRRQVSNGPAFDKFFGNPPGPDDQIRKILASRYFAPKITDVSGRVPRAYGWRKVIRLRPRNGSPAAGRKIEAMFLLFNFFQPEADAKKDPFEMNSSVNNQVILTRTKEPGLLPAYFLVFEELKKGGTLKLFLDATFDAQDPNLPQPAPYYVPNACIVCHSHKVLASRPRLNYLDTDHFRDRVEPNDDFADLYAKSDHGVLFDGGRDETTKKFQEAFGVIRQLNTEIRDQNKAVFPTPDKDNFQLRAVETWLSHHPEGKHQYLPILDRAMTPIDGEPWKKGNAVDEALLPMLNRYCYRCHSSVKFNVFDREMVRERIGGTAGMLVRIQPTTSLNQRMPQDRNLDQSVIDRLTQLLQQIEQH